MKGVWARPLSMWNDEVIVDNVKQRRFVEVVMFYYKHFDTGEPQCISSIEGFLKKVEKKFPKLHNKFQRLKTEVVSDGIIVGILIQS